MAGFIRFVFIFLFGFNIYSIHAQTFDGQGGLLVPPGAPQETVGITTSIATVSGIGILGSGCSYIDHITMDFIHTWVGDVALFLIAPSGQVLELSSSNGGSGDNYQVTVFTDNTPLFITSGSPPYNGTFRPEGRQTSTVPPFSNMNALGTHTFESTFNGVNADGDWTLMINDYVALDVGVLNSWSITFEVGGGPAPEVTLGPDVTICPGQTTTLVAEVTPSADSYLWSTGATTSSINVSPSVTTTYSVTVTNNACIDADTIQVIVNPNGVNANAGSDVSICQGNSTTLTGSGGSASATYAWSNGQNGSTISVNPSTTTTYTLTVTDNGCTDTDQVVVTVTPLPNADAGPPVTICEGQSTTLTASGGFQNNHYLWSTGQTGSTITVTPNSTTIYSVTVTINGCSASDNVLVTVNDVPNVDAGSDEQICEGESVTLTANGSGGTYLWSTGQSGASITVSPSVTTTYTVTLTNNGCSATDQVTVIVGEINANLPPDQSICEGSTITLTASGGNNYLWSTGETTSSITVSPLITTTYSVTVSQGSCTDEAAVLITVNPVPTASVSPDAEICAGENITLTASGGTSYQWSSGHNTSTINVNPGITTTYTVTVSDNGCSSSASVQVIVNPSPNASIGPDQDICEGEAIDLVASGLIGSGTYEWSTGETTQTITVEPLVTTNYAVTITNQWNCADVDMMTVNVYPIPIANAGPDQDLCSGETATLIASGGTAPSTYHWSTGQTGSTITVSPMTNEIYTVTVTVDGCSSEDEVEVFVLTAPIADAGPDEEICSGLTIEISASGGGSYQWSTGQSVESIEVAPSVTTTYTVTVTSANGCTDEDQVTVFVNTLPNADAGPDQEICEADDAFLNASGGGTYLWSTGETSPGINVTPSGTTSYTVTVSDNNGCTDSDIVTVTVNPVPFANAGPNIFILAGESAMLTASGGTTYLWSTGETTAQINVMPSATTTYSVTVTSNGCSDVDDVTVFVDEAPTVDLGPDLVICEGETASLNASISGPFDMSYQWNTGETTNIINVSPVITTSYSVTATDNVSGLFSVDTIHVTVLTLPLGTPLIQGSISVCENDTVTYTVVGVTGVTIYNWSVPADAVILSGQGTPSIEIDWTGSNGGSINLTVSNSCGSIPTVSMSIEVISIPVLAGPIDGTGTPCAISIIGYSIPEVPEAITYQWTVSGGGLITSGQGTSNIIIDWNNSAGGDVCVIASNQCGNSSSICMPVNTTPQPVLNAGLDVASCGTTATLSASGIGMWNFVSGPGTVQFSDINDSLATINASQSGSYLLNYSLSMNGCTTEDQIEIEFFEQPLIANLISDCDGTNTSYIVSFTISDGLEPYIVNGTPITGSTFQSNPIPSGGLFSFQVTDANGCLSQQVSDQIMCSCTSTAGNMNSELIEACINETVIGNYLGGEVLDADDKLAFILHDGNIPGGIIAWNVIPEFVFQAPIVPGTTYYISAVTGNEGSDGFPEISDPCFAISNATPIVFHDLTGISIVGDTTICEGNCASILITASTAGTLNVVYTANGNPYTNFGADGVVDISVCPETTTVYTFTSVSDQNCIVSISEDIEVAVQGNVFAGESTSTSICEHEDEIISLQALLINADLGGIWTEVSQSLSSPGSFDPANATFNAGAEVPGSYLFQYAIAGLNDCPGSSSIVEVVIHELPIAFAGPNQIIGCDPSGIVISALGSSSGPDIAYEWQTQNGIIDGSFTSEEVTILKEGDYILKVINTLTGCTGEDTIVIHSSNFTLDGIQIETHSPVCHNDCNAMITVQGSTQGLTFDFGDGVFTTDHIYEEACSGLTNLIVMDSVGCRQDTLIFIDNPPLVEVDLGPDQQIELGESITIIANSVNNIIQYDWAPLSCVNCPEITVSPTENTIYSVVVTDQNQCQATDEIDITVKVSNNIYIPVIFSPNGDQVNDVFTIHGSQGIEKILVLQIFDRWGNKIYEAKEFPPGDSSKGWNGYFDGSPVNPGVYLYLVEILFTDGKSSMFTGDITVVK